MPANLAAAPEPLPPDTTVVRVCLTVRDLDRVARFYTHVVGLDEVGAGPGAVSLGAGDRPFLELVEDRDAERAPTAPGLYHLAVLYPSRADLAAVSARLVGLRAPLQGASDHGVSEAVYLADPEGNGVEVYCDRPSAEWPVRDGRLAMDTRPLDLGALLSEAPEPEGWRVPADTRLGHVHLRVADTGAAEAFYRDVVGLDLMQRYGDSASFLSAGGYHHHLAVNSWGMVAGTRAPDGGLGLRWFELGVSDPSARQRLRHRLDPAGAPHADPVAPIRGRDPAGNAFRA